jgi:hypothetical protein
VVVGADGRALDRMEGFEGAQPMVKWVSQAGMRRDSAARRVAAP